MKSTVGIKVAVMAAGAAVMSLGLATSPAHATSPATPDVTSSEVTPSGMKFYDDFWTKKECMTVGNWGLDHGKWTVFDCQASLWDWDLYYDN